MKSLNQKSILVTGGSGFIGSHLCENLLSSGNNVICVDNLFSSNKNNINRFINNENFEFYRHDITFPLYLEVNQIFNFACPASPIHYQYDPVQTLKTSIHGSINMLGLAKRTNSKIFRLQLAKSMVIRRYHLNLKVIQVKLTLLALELVMMKGKELQKLF